MTERLEIKPMSTVPGTKCVDGAICKYSHPSIFRKRCSKYMTTWCVKCRYYFNNQREEKTLSKNGNKSYYDRISGL